MNIGERIKFLRAGFGYTLEHVAKMIGTSKQTIQRYESGVITNIPPDKIEALAVALNTTPAYLMGWTETLGSRIKKIRNKENISISILSSITNIPKSMISRFEDDIETPSSSELEKIASCLQINITDLLFDDNGAPIAHVKDINIANHSNIRPITLKKFRMLGEIACGAPIYANEEYETYIDASADIKADFCLTARGDSMIGAKISDGDIVFIREQPMVDNGQIAAVIINDEVTLKRWYFYPEKKKLVLNPENPKYEPLVYVGDELNEIRCLGRAVSLMSNL